MTPNLYEEIIAQYPELAAHPEYFWNGTIMLQDDMDGIGPYIREWNLTTPPRPNIGPSLEEALAAQAAEAQVNK